MVNGKAAILASTALIATACVPTTRPVEGTPEGADAYALIGVPPAPGAPERYVIGALDELDVTVFLEPELSVDDARVDTEGNVTLPLLGPVRASGLTTGEFSRNVETALAARYLRQPSVSTSVTASASQKVIVTGEVNQAGVYDIRGRATLLEALALARGESRIAKLRDVVIFRNIDGQRMAARFDVAAIRSGAAADPQILGNDVVVVGASAARAIWRDVLSALPLFAVFRPVYS